MVDTGGESSKERALEPTAPTSSWHAAAPAQGPGGQHQPAPLPASPAPIPASGAKWAPEGAAPAPGEHDSGLQGPAFAVANMAGSEGQALRAAAGSQQPGKENQAVPVPASDGAASRKRRLEGTKGQASGGKKPKDAS